MVENPSSSQGPLRAIASLTNKEGSSSLMQVESKIWQ